MRTDGAGLPSGLVTFVFTDIEGSTRRLQRHGGDAYGDVADRHDALLRAAWNDHGGVEVGTEGDAFFVAFADAAAALSAAVDAQRGIAGVDWPDGDPLRVRGAADHPRRGRPSGRRGAVPVVDPLPRHSGVDLTPAELVELTTWGPSVADSDRVDGARALVVDLDDGGHRGGAGRRASRSSRSGPRTGTGLALDTDDERRRRR